MKKHLDLAEERRMDSCSFWEVLTSNTTNFITIERFELPKVTKSDQT